MLSYASSLEGAPRKGSEARGADRTLKTIQRRETRKKREGPGGGIGTERGREPERGPRDSEDSKEFRRSAERKRSELFKD